MESLPKTMIDVLSGVLKENRNFSWRVHGMHDKVVMNIMWSNTNGSNPDFPQKKFTLASPSFTAGLSPQSITEENNLKTDSTICEDTPPTSVTETLVTSENPSKPVTGKREGRKVLPPIPDSETEAEMSASVVNKNSIMTGGGGGGNGQFKLEYILMNEYNMLHKQKLPGIYVIPSALSPFIWNGVIFIRQGLYQEAVFRFNLNIPENYPNGDCPRVFFEFPVFHPLVDPKTFELDVKREFKKWRRNANFLWQVLLYVRRVFFKIDPKCPLNTEAAELYEHSMEEFRKRIEECVSSSKEVLYNPIESNDAHMIRFSPWDSGIHEEAKSDMLTRKKNRSDLETEPHKKNGLSWIKPGTTQTFSQEEVNTAR
ncbi:AKT-interacting protein-like isoform X2 [Ruditapes philippinarum]|uniref:AKT-interacting protein-like isoform X2 n=1 Tax=Ruditapes philippinarum TaxID=129788 RepID=UPI00295AB1C1|nr:AKT-interacting protein-like isoform X2 [Ruditapes philippinarum]